MLEILFGWRKASRCKDLIKRVQCRLKLLKSKRETVVRQLHEDVVKLLRNGLHESALTWVEQLFKNQSILAAYDLLDHFCEFIIINLPYIRRHRDCPNDISEAVSSLIFAATRCGDLPELQMLQKLFGERYGNDYVVAAAELCPGNHVNQQISEKLRVRSISDAAKLKVIEEIAKDHNIQLKSAEINDACNLQRRQVHDLSVERSDCGLEKQFSERNDIKVLYRDITGAQVKASNDRQRLHFYQHRHFGYADHLQEKARSSSSYSKTTMPSSCQPHDSSDIDSSIDDLEIGKCMPDKVSAVKSFRIHTSMEEAEKLNELEPSYERTFVYIDDAEDNHLSMLEYDEDRFASTGSLQSYQCRKQCVEKHKPRKNQSKRGIGITGSYGEETRENGTFCKSPSKDGKSSLSGLYCCNCAQMLKEFGQAHDGGVRHCNVSKRKSARTSSRRTSISMKNDLQGDYRDTNELGRLCETSQRIYRRTNHQRDYDHDPISNLANGLHMRSGLHGEKEHNEIMLRNMRKYPSQGSSYYAQRMMGDVLCEVPLGSCTSHVCLRRSCHSCSWKCDRMQDCCLEHPCFFFAIDSKTDWESLPLNGSTVTIVTGCPFSIQLQEQEDRCHCQCYAQDNYINQIENVYHQGTSTICARCNVDLNSNINVSNNSACMVQCQDLRSQEHEEAVKEASNHCKKSNSSISNSSEILPLSSGSLTNVQQPFPRALTRPLREQSRITPTNQSSHAASFLFQQHNRHVHPKLPDYDELAAKFMALKKEHLQRTRQLSGT